MYYNNQLCKRASVGVGFGQLGPRSSGFNGGKCLTSLRFGSVEWKGGDGSNEVRG